MFIPLPESARKGRISNVHTPKDLRLTRSQKLRILVTPISPNRCDEKTMGQEELDGIPLTERDKAILSQTDEEYHLFTWDDLKTTIGISVAIDLSYSTVVDSCRQE
jgi:hypothetical protein